jgi:hypothetical protein
VNRVKASKVTGIENCGSVLKQTPIPCDRASCLHVCRGVAHWHTGCPDCTWGAECQPDGCTCTVCAPEQPPNNDKEIDTSLQT